MSEKEVDTLFKEIDASGNGYIDFEEFLNIIMNKMKDPYTQDELEDAFKIFDSDNNGSVNAAELKSVLMKLGD